MSHLKGKKFHFNNFYFTRCWWSSTGHEWITNIALVTDTHGDMIGHLTVGIGATETWAGINTVEVSALFACRAVRVDDTLRSAGNVGVSKVVRDALTGTSRTSLGADSIRSTGRREARIDNLCRNWQCCNSGAESEWVSSVSWVTSTTWVVILN